MHGSMLPQVAGTSGDSDGRGYRVCGLCPAPARTGGDPAV